MTIGEISDLGSESRGVVIHYMIRMERVLDLYLSSYFTNEETKQQQLLLLVFANERITLGSKKEVLDFLCKEKYVSLLDDYPELLTDFNLLIRWRNILAHWYIDTTKEAQLLPEGVIRFIKLKNVMESKEEHTLTVEKYNGLLTKIAKIEKLLYSKMPTSPSNYIDWSKD
jgi:hypothetical protein